MTPLSLVTRAASALARALRPPGASAPIAHRGGWWPLIREPFTGAWQQNVEWRLVDVVSHPTVYACVTLIASDIAKMRLRLMTEGPAGIWTETASGAFSPVLRKPNRVQTRIQFFETWVVSKLLHGNTYALKVRDDRSVVTALYVLDPTRVTPLIAPDGGVYYELSRDDLAGLPDGALAVPAREIIHDVMVPLYHPLCGISPIVACGLAALQGLRIQDNSAKFFAQGSNPGALLIAPGAITQEQAFDVSTRWNTGFTGGNAGKVAVLGDAFKYEKLTMNAVDAELIDQLKWTSEAICACFHVPAYKVGAAPDPTYNNIGALNQQYYAQCLQSLIEAIELLLDEGLALPSGLGVAFDLDDLLRMDTTAMIESERAAVGAGIKTPNEARARLNLAPVAGGDTPYMQEQNFALSALAARDAASPAPAPADDDPDVTQRFLTAFVQKATTEGLYAA